MKFEPKFFLRTHSRKDDSADVQSQVWQCAFQPEEQSDSESSSIVATCGSESVCLINVHSGEVEQKFIANRNELFYALAWGRLLDDDVMEVVLAAGGAQNRIYIITPRTNAIQVSAKLADSRKKITINSLLFHPTETNILICGMSDGRVFLLKVDPSVASLVQTVHTFDDVHKMEGEVLQLAYCEPCTSLVAACSTGLISWEFAFLNGKVKAKCIEIALPKPTFCTEESKMSTSSSPVDTVVTIGDNKSSILATKHCEEGYILLFDFAKIHMVDKPKSGRATAEVVKGQFLKWSDTDNWYMGIGWNDRTKALVCGDDRGSLWYYALPEQLLGDTLGLLPLTTPPLQPTAIIPWPRVTDTYCDIKRKVKLDTYDIVITKTALSGPYIVAVTKNNVVCVWKCEAP